MPTVYTVLVTAVACAAAGALIHFLRDRMAKPGTHSLADRLYSVGTVVAVDEHLIAAKTREAEQAARDHRALLDRTRHDGAPIRVAEPRISGTDARLLANTDPSLLCGDYGGHEPMPQWPTARPT